MKTSIATAVLLLTTGAWAQSAPGSSDHNAHHPPAAASAPAPATAAAPQAGELAEGEVRRIDKASGKITLRHGEIRNLDMPPMTMVFAVNEPAMLDQVKPGDKVRFRAADQGGRLTITHMQASD